MNDIQLYEKIPEDDFPVRLHRYNNHPFRFCLHWHEHTEIHFIFGGSAQIRCADEEIHLKKGDCFIVNGNELHEGLSGVCDYGCIILPPSFFENNHVIFENLINDSAAAELIASIFAEYEEFNPVSSLAIKGYTYVLISYLIKNHTLKTLSESTYRQYSEKLGRVNNAIKYINENYSESIATSELADMVHMSEGHFCHVFKDVTGKTAKEYINSIRVKRAAALLSGTGMTVTEAAYCCGFSDSNYFARIFKKYTGSTPNSLRKHVQPE